MADIKSLDQIVQKWIRVTPTRTTDYQTGVQNPTTDWATAASAQEDAWQQGVSAAAARRAFSRGVQETGTPGWQSATLQKGVPRWGPGVQASEAQYRSGFGPYHGVIARTPLPPRGPAGDPHRHDALYHGRSRRAKVAARLLQDL